MVFFSLHKWLTNYSNYLWTQNMHSGKCEENTNKSSNRLLTVICVFLGSYCMNCEVISSHEKNKMNVPGEKDTCGWSWPWQCPVTWYPRYCFCPKSGKYLKVAHLYCICTSDISEISYFYSSILVSAVQHAKVNKY